MPEAQVSKIDSPNLAHSFTEAGRVALEGMLLWASRGVLRKITPHSKSRPIIVIPGFLGADWTTALLRGFLAQKGHDVYGWHGGINTGPSVRVLDHLDEHLDNVVHAHDGQKVTLIGHSLGGVFAREMARKFPHQVDQVITLGSPFAAGIHSGGVNSLVRHAFEMMNGAQHPFLTDRNFSRQAAIPPPVPTTSVYSRGDGVVHWKTCRNPDGYHDTQDIEVMGSHCGLVINPLSLIVCADRLANRDTGKWQPFDAQSYYKALLSRNRPVQPA